MRPARRPFRGEHDLSGSIDYCSVLFHFDDAPSRFAKALVEGFEGSSRPSRQARAQRALGARGRCRNVSASRNGSCRNSRDVCAFARIETSTGSRSSPAASRRSDEGVRSALAFGAVPRNCISAKTATPREYSSHAAGERCSANRPISPSACLADNGPRPTER